MAKAMILEFAHVAQERGVLATRHLVLTDEEFANAHLVCRRRLRHSNIGTDAIDVTGNADEQTVVGDVDVLLIAVRRSAQGGEAQPRRESLARQAERRVRFERRGAERAGDVQAEQREGAVQTDRCSATVRRAATRADERAMIS